MRPPYSWESLIEKRLEREDSSVVPIKISLHKMLGKEDFRRNNPSFFPIAY